jgi:hypothetical protein
MAGVVRELLCEYGVEERLGYLVGDNASNNNTLVRGLADMRVFGKHYYDVQEHQLCCIGHVIILLDKAFRLSEVDRTPQRNMVSVTHDTIAEWRKTGPWGKAHNITIYVQASPPQQQKVLHSGGSTILHRDDETCCNTGYSMIESVIWNRDAVDIIGLCSSDMLEEDPLCVDDWDQLADAVSILQSFYSTTLHMEVAFAEQYNIRI